MIIRKVQLFPSVDNNGQPLPALKVKLRNYYSMALGADSYLVISEKSGFQFSRFDYYIPTQEAYGNLDDFSLEVYSGRLSAGPTKFVISTLNGSPVNLHFRNVAFEKDHQIAFAKGSLQTSLGEGSEILLSADQANLSSLKLIPPSNLAAQDLSLSVQDGTPDRLFVGHATCTATVVDGRLALGPTDHLRISSAHVSLELNDSFWQSPGRPLVLGRIYDLDVNVAGGELRINQESKLSLAQGRVAATSLNIDSRLNVPITGAFKQLRIDVSPESQLTYAPIFSLITIDGNQGDRRIVAQLIADDSANPLTIQANVPYLSGKFALQVPFRKGDFKLGKTGKIVNASGYFEGGINIANKDQVTGSFNFDVSSPSGEIAVNGATTLLISGIKAKGSNFQFVNTALSSGTLIEAKMNIDSGAEFSLPGGFRILTDGGGYLAAQRLSVGSNAFLVGDYQLSMPFIKFSNGNDNSFSLTRGQALLNLSNRPDGSITGAACNIRGLANLAIGTLSLQTAVEISKGTIKWQANRPYLTGLMTTTIPSLRLPGITTQANPDMHLDDDRIYDATMFAVQLGGTLKSPIAINQVPFEIDGTQVSIAVMPLSITLAIDVPALPPGKGGGEHIDWRDPGKGTQDEADEEYGNMQEVFVGSVRLPTVLLPDMRVHLYAQPTGYTASIDLEVGMQRNVPRGQIKSLRLDRKVEFVRQGGNPTLFTTVVGCLGGVIGCAVGAGIGEALNFFVDKLISARIEDRVGSFSLRFGF